MPLNAVPEAMLTMRPFLFSDHDRSNSLGTLKRAAHVHLHHAVPLVLIDIEKRLGVQVGKQAGIVDENVDGAECLRHPRRRTVDRRLRRNVRVDVDGRSLRLANALDNRAAVEDIGDNHLGPGGGQAFTEGSANATRAAGDDCYFILEPRIHGYLPASLHSGR